MSNATTNIKALATQSTHKIKSKLVWLSLAALGVVYGDIGTSPLYAVNKIFFGNDVSKITVENVYGGISLIVWALTIIITLKYLIFVLRADNDGEGGVFALYGLLNQHKKTGAGILMTVLVLAAGLLFGDGIITPAISVLSAVEGLSVATPIFDNFIVLITVIILTGLFAIQHKGTSKVGSIFGPVIMCWFVIIGVLGASQIVQNPEIVNAFNPIYAINFIKHAGLQGSFIILGAVMLAITGGEALYADMGHFGKTPIRLSWFTIVFPSLILNYLGQGAYLISGQTVTNGNIFYSMVPEFALYPMVILATAATIIASQALISGAFSLTAQAMALRLFPRVKIVHTHDQHEGQIYLRFINWALYVGCVLLVILFKSSSSLASAYGLAVSGVMFATTLAMFGIAKHCWNWRPIRTWLLFGSLAVIDGSFLMANSLKFLEGGFIPISIGIFLFIVMITWKWGRRTTIESYTQLKTMTMKELVALKTTAKELINRTMIIMAPKVLRSESDETPAIMQFLWDRYGVLPKNIIFVDVVTKKVPYIRGDRYFITNFQKDQHKGSIIAVEINFGFMEDPNVENILEELAHHHKIALSEDYHKWLVHVTLDRLVPTKNTSFFRRLKLGLYSLLREVSQPAYDYYGLGKEVNLTLEMLPIKIH